MMLLSAHRRFRLYCALGVVLLALSAVSVGCSRPPCRTCAQIFFQIPVLTRAPKPDALLLIRFNIPETLGALVVDAKDIIQTDSQFWELRPTSDNIGVTVLLTGPRPLALGADRFLVREFSMRLPIRGALLEQLYTKGLVFRLFSLADLFRFQRKSDKEIIELRAAGLAFAMDGTLLHGEGDNTSSYSCYNTFKRDRITFTVNPPSAALMTWRNTCP